MRSCSTLAAGVLIATAALTGVASGPADGARPTRHAPTLTVAITSDKSGTEVDRASFRPGNTMFDITGAGAVEIVRLKRGYTIDDLAADFGNLFAGDVPTVRRVDRKVVFLGGAKATQGGASAGMFLSAGSYYVVNLDLGSVATFRVAGAPEKRALPAADGEIDYVGDMRYDAPDRLPHEGYLEFVNRSDEPHFTDLQKLRAGTTRAQVKKFLTSGASGHPRFLMKEFHDTLIVSPGHSFVWHLKASRGEYGEFCFWPSDETGMPHAYMGMFDLSTLT